MAPSAGSLCFPPAADSHVRPPRGAGARSQSGMTGENALPWGACPRGTGVKRVPRAPVAQPADSGAVSPALGSASCWTNPSLGERSPWRDWAGEGRSPEGQAGCPKLVLGASLSASVVVRSQAGAQAVSCV